MRWLVLVAISLLLGCAHSAPAREGALPAPANEEVFDDSRDRHCGNSDDYWGLRGSSE
jgi:hypothetical protein